MGAYFDSSVSMRLASLLGGSLGDLVESLKGSIGFLKGIYRV